MLDAMQTSQKMQLKFTEAPDQWLVGLMVGGIANYNRKSGEELELHETNMYPQVPGSCL
jgi:hypothetical protein